MNNRFIMALTTMVAIAFAVMGALSFISGSMLSNMAMLALVGAFSLALLFHWRKYWVALLLAGTLWLNQVSAPLVDIFTMGVLLQIAIVCIAWGERIILKKRSAWEINAGDRAMILFGVILLVQVAIEHPGSARLGGTGGLGMMIYYVLAGWLYIGTMALALDPWSERSATRWFVGTSLLFESYGILTRGLEGMFNAFFNMFWVVGFPLFAGLLAWGLRRWVTGKATIFSVLGIILLVLSIAFYSQFRACPHIALGMIVFIALIFRVRFRFWMIIVGLLLGCWILLQIVPVQSIPESMRRTFSTFRSIDRVSMRQNDVYLSEFGWESEFRADLWTRAKMEISAHPLLGAGWGFSFDDIVAAVSRGGQEGMKSSNALAGGYHNGLFTLAAKSGLPVALLWTFAFLYVLLRFLRHIPRDKDSRMLSAVLVGTLLGQTVVFLTNGGGQECVHMAVMLGVMSALTKRWGKKSDVPAVALVPEPVVVRARGSLGVG